MIITRTEILSQSLHFSKPFSTLLLLFLQPKNPSPPVLQSSRFTDQFHDGVNLERLAE